ncbi:uncharacterized protein LOC115896414 [Rhinopithecus roxellana]|uniref:uncharacterized protein LOC115896414 n=1 Tax=Rhinopithecus roxellana TaxID=61622 RepID=UPI0012372227|nr:uncharacterized protein LOC115896414 [Rhinopithecus roxellana]
MPSAASKGCQGGAARGCAAPPLGGSAVPGFRGGCRKSEGSKREKHSPTPSGSAERRGGSGCALGRGLGGAGKAPPLSEGDLAAALSPAGNRVQSLNNCGALLRPARSWTPRHPHCTRKHGPSPRSGHSRNRP